MQLLLVFFALVLIWSVGNSVCYFSILQPMFHFNSLTWPQHELRILSYKIPCKIIIVKDRTDCIMILDKFNTFEIFPCKKSKLFIVWYTRVISAYMKNRSSLTARICCRARQMKKPEEQCPCISPYKLIGCLYKQNTNNSLHSLILGTIFLIQHVQHFWIYWTDHFGISLKKKKNLPQSGIFCLPPPQPNFPTDFCILLSFYLALHDLRLMNKT